MLLFGYSVLRYTLDAQVFLQPQPTSHTQHIMSQSHYIFNLSPHLTHNTPYFSHIISSTSAHISHTTHHTSVTLYIQPQPTYHTQHTIPQSHYIFNLSPHLTHNTPYLSHTISVSGLTAHLSKFPTSLNPYCNQCWQGVTSLVTMATRV